MIIVEASNIPHFEVLDMGNLQYEIRICRKNHTKVTATMSKVYPFFLKQSLVKMIQFL